MYYSNTSAQLVPCLDPQCGPTELCLAQWRGESQVSHRQGCSLLTPSYTLSRWVTSTPRELSVTVCTSGGIHRQIQLLGLLPPSGHSLQSTSLSMEGRLFRQDTLGSTVGCFSGKLGDRVSATCSLCAVLVLMQRKQRSFREECVSLEMP